MVRGERGQTAAELMGMLLLVAAIIGAIAGSGVGQAVAGGVRAAICTIAGAGCESAPGDPRPGESPAEALARREAALASFAASGDGFAELLGQARAARERGDLEEADRLLGLLEEYQRLTASDRGDLVSALAGPSDADFADLVGQGTIDEDGRNRRYFDVAPSPGDGIVAMDFFIPGASSGPLRGDDRDTVDPLLGDASLDESRIMIVIDRETGRGVITQSHTCMADAVPGNYCENPRPIELRDPKTRPQTNPIPGPQGANEFRVDGGDGTLEIEYDALNSITPVGVSVDGTVRFERGADGDYHVVSDSRDHYPRIVTGQYQAGDEPEIIDETDDEPVLPGALPGPVHDVIHGAGEVVDEACDLPLGGPFGPLGGLGGQVAGGVLC
ncbi:MAG TPA: hypothetical protein VF533_11815 [Solirubrobacteraceae bacterium]